MPDHAGSVDLEDLPPRGPRAFDRIRQTNAEHELVYSPDRIAQDRQPGMIWRSCAQFSEIIRVARDDHPIFRDRQGENVFIRRTEKPAISNMDGVEAMRRRVVISQQRRQIFVDQEARRHSLPLGRPRGGFALA